MYSKVTRTLPKLAYRKLRAALNLQRTRAVIHPFKPATKKQKEPTPPNITVFDYSPQDWETATANKVEDCFHYLDTDTITWINMSGLSNAEIISISNQFGIHNLLQEDIMSYGQRPKMDEINNIFFAQMNMLFINEDDGIIEQEQISIALGKNFILSFQEDALRDVFDPLRAKIKLPNSKIRNSPSDYLFYSMIDIIVDSYYHVIEKLGAQIEEVEEQILERANPASFNKLNQLRKDIILIRRNTLPVRDLVAAIIRSDSDLLEDNTTKYFKDVYDHIVQANDLTENYRELIMSLQDLYMNNINLRMNEVMKTLAIITAIMAPATVIGGIFGMNFSNIPYSEHPMGFYITVLFMILIPIAMLIWFNNRKWFQKELPDKKAETN